MGDKNFSTELRRLRILANLTLRGLAKKVDVDFSYLNKIENGVLPPPSEKVITKLAKALKVNKEELMDLAGRLPHDLIKFLKSKAKSEFGSTVRGRRIKAKLTQ